MFGNDDIFFPSQIRLCCWWLTYISQEISLLGCKWPSSYCGKWRFIFRDPQGKKYENWSFILALGFENPYDSFPRYRLLGHYAQRYWLFLGLGASQEITLQGNAETYPTKKGKARKNHLIIDWKVPFLVGGYMIYVIVSKEGTYPFLENLQLLDREFPVPLGQSLGQQLPPSGRLTKKTCPQPTKSVCFARFSLWGEGRCL